MPHCPPTPPQRTGRRRAGLVALIAVAGVLATSIVAIAQTEPQLRIQARVLSDGRTEVALQQRVDGEQWSDRLLPERRLMPPNPPLARWLWSSPLEVQTAAGPQEMRIAARRPTGGGRIEVGLQQRRPDGSWSEVILPALRIVPAGAPVGRWLGSSPLHEPVFREQAAEAGPTDQPAPPTNPTTQAPPTNPTTPTPPTNPTTPTPPTNPTTPTPPTNPTTGTPPICPARC